MKDAEAKQSKELRPATIAFVTVGIVLVCGAALPVGYHAGRIQEVRRVVWERANDPSDRRWGAAKAEVGSWVSWVDDTSTIAKLGGPHEAAERLAGYLRLPDWIAPNKEEAVWLLGECGEAGKPALRAALGHENERIRKVTAWVLNLNPKSPRSRWERMIRTMGYPLGDGFR